MVTINTTDYNFEKVYANILHDCLINGIQSNDRTGVGTIRKQHAYFEWAGIPILRGKQQFINSIIAEAIWMLAGKTDIESLSACGCGYWKHWVREDGTFGRIYGAQIRDFGGGQTLGFDQLKYVCNKIINESDCRRIIMSLWNPNDFDNMALPPCHIMYQFCVVEGKVNMHVTQRSADAFIGVPYDFILVSIILQLICIFCNMQVGRIYYTCNDFHIYNNQIEAVDLYLSRINSIDIHDCYNSAKCDVTYDYGLYTDTCDIDVFIDNLFNAKVNGDNIFNVHNYTNLGRIMVDVAK